MSVKYTQWSLQLWEGVKALDMSKAASKKQFMLLIDEYMKERDRPFAKQAEPEVVPEVVAVVKRVSKKKTATQKQDDQETGEVKARKRVKIVKDEPAVPKKQTKARSKSGKK